MNESVMGHVCHGCIIVCVLLTIPHMCQSGASDRTTSGVTSDRGISENVAPTDKGGISHQINVHNSLESQNRKNEKEMIKPSPPKLHGSMSKGKKGKKRPVRSPQQGTAPLQGTIGGVLQDLPSSAVYGDILPTMTMDMGASVNFPYQYEQPESPAEQQQDLIEDMLDMLRLRGYTHTVLPDNMSMYPDIMNYTDAEGPEGHEEGEDAEEAGEMEEQEVEEYEADEHPMMSANITGFGYEAEDAEEYEEEDGLQPSGTQFPPHIVHNMSDMASEAYDPYYNYGYKYYPKKNEPLDSIKPTPVLNGPSMVKVMVASQTPGVADGNATAGAQAQMVDNPSVTKKKVADYGGLSVSTTFGIVVGTIVGFWLVMGPMVCLLMKVRDHRKEKQKRFLIGPRSTKVRKSDKGIMEAMIMTELGKLPHHKTRKHFLREKKPNRSQERMSLTDDRETETFHDAYDSPEMLP